VVAEERWRVLRLHVEDQVPLTALARDAGDHTVQQIGEAFGVSRPTIYRHLGPRDEARSRPA